jgi:NADP-dependent 3-hydroxy acid dehydrogenase YdfG
MKIDCDLSGRVAVVTGASSGIGEQTARAFAAAGATVALAARRVERLNKMVSEIRDAGGVAAAHPVDVTDPDAVTAVAARIREEPVAAGIVFNNAGIMLPGTAGQLAGPDSARQVELNITALNTVIGAFADQLVESATAHGCADLVNTVSIAGRQRTSSCSLAPHPATCGRPSTIHR